MTFVFPLLLGGLVLAGVPVLVHFLVRKKPTPLLFPAYRFLVQKKRTNTRNLRLRHLLLLLLRMLLIALICFALARPRLLHEQFGISRERPVALALVFDTTPSMEYKVGDETRLDLAKKRALELLDQLPGDCRVLILDAADPETFGREDWHSSLEKARQRIQTLTLQPTSVPVTTALAEAQRRLEARDEAEAVRLPRFVCVFSDRTRASWDGSAATKREGDAPVLYFDVGVDEPVDFAIDRAELAGAQQAFLERDKVPLQVVVSATAKATSAVLVTQGDKTLVAQNFSVEAGKPQTLALEIDAAALGLRPGLHQVEVKWEGSTDLLPHNNRRFVTFKILPRPRVLVIADDLARARRFAFALECLDFAVTKQASGDDKINLSESDAVFLVGVKAPAEKLWLNLADYVKSGRGVCIIPGGAELSRAAYNGAAAQTVMPALVERVVETPGARWSDGADADWDHPFMSLYRKWFVAGTADLIQNPRSAKRYWRVQPHDKKGVIVRYENQDAAIVERPPAKDAGKVLLLTTPMDEQPTAWNNYDENLNSFYLGLTLMCGRYLCVEAEAQIFNHQFGQKPPTVTKSLAFPKYLLTAGDFSEEIRFDGDRWTAERLPRASNYAVVGADGEAATTLAKFSVNIAAEESDLTRIPVVDIEAVLGKDAVVPQDRRRSIVDTLNWDEPVELFPWLMIGLLFLLAVENLLANRFYRRSEPDA